MLPYSHAEPGGADEYLWPSLLRLLPPPCRVFEIGCGNGATARKLAAEGYSVTGIDPSPSGIAIAKGYEGQRLRFEQASTDDDLRRFGTFPVVISLEVIEHCPSPQSFMRAFESVLAPCGVGIISTPYHGYLKNLLVVGLGGFDRHFDPLWEGGHLKFFTERKLRDLFAGHGFGVEFHRVGRIPPIAKSVIAVLKR